jgi:hypothetical protein
MTVYSNIKKKKGRRKWYDELREDGEKVFQTEMMKNNNILIDGTSHCRYNDYLSLVVIYGSRVACQTSSSSTPM